MTHKKQVTLVGADASVSVAKLHILAIEGLTTVRLVVKGLLKIEGLILFRTACVEIHRILCSTPNLELSKI
jgi:hypothetical protein